MGVGMNKQEIAKELNRIDSKINDVKFRIEKLMSDIIKGG